MGGWLKTRRASSPSRSSPRSNRHDVNYIIIGGVAARAHGTLLRTGDVDICPEASDANAARLAAALADLNARVYVDADTPALAMPFDGELLRRQVILNLLTRFGRLDVLWQPAGTGGFEDLAADARVVKIRGVPARVAGIEALIRSKEATDRPKDREWLTQLRFIRERPT